MFLDNKCGFVGLASKSNAVNAVATPDIANQRPAHAFLPANAQLLPKSAESQSGKSRTRSPSMSRSSWKAPSTSCDGLNRSTCKEARSGKVLNPCCGQAPSLHRHSPWQTHARPTSQDSSSFGPKLGMWALRPVLTSRSQAAPLHEPEVASTASIQCHFCTARHVTTKTGS